MALPPLVLPSNDHPLAVAWKSIQLIVKGDTGLQSVVKTFRLMEGDVDEFMPPTLAELPWLRVCPIACPMGIGSESEWEVDFQFSYELGVNGTAVVDLINLFGLFVKALSQSTVMPDGFGTVQAYYRNANIRVIEITSAAIGPTFSRAQPGAPPPPFMKAQGIVRGQVFFSN